MRKTVFTYFAVVMGLICLSQQTYGQSMWTKDYRENVFNTLYNGLEMNFPNDSIKMQFTGCLVDKLKNSLPEGVASVSRDSLDNLITKFGAACKAEMNAVTLTQWSPAFEKSFFLTIHESLKKSLPETSKNDICSCMIKSYKQRFPDGMPKDVSPELNQNVLSACIMKLIKEGKLDRSVFSQE